MHTYQLYLRRFLNYFLGPVLFVWLTLSIYHQVKNQPDLAAALQKIKTALVSEQSWRFWVVLLLMLVNWGIEARKWQLLMKPVDKMSWWKAFKATLAGVAFAMNTPNRIGEYGGRILYVQEGKRMKAVSLTLAGSLSQLIVTLLLGCAGLIFLLNMQGSATNAINLQSYLFWIRLVLYVVAGIAVGALLIYFRLTWLVKWLKKIPGISRFTQPVAVLEEVGVTILLRVFSLSVTRYIVFVIQYILMLQLMQVEVNIWQAFWLITVMFLVLAIIPTIALAEIGLRGQVSLELFGLVSANKIGIITASVGMWGINLVIPALVGSLFIVGIKIFENK